MKQIKKIISGAFIGVGIGFTINLIYSHAYGYYVSGVPSFIQQFDTELYAITLQTIIFMVLGVIQSYSSDIMKNEEKSLTYNTITHFIVIMSPLLVVAYVLHWSRNLIGILSIGILISLVYGIIWIAMYLGIKAQINKINSNIQHRNSQPL
jgi:hypothetical protein